MRQATKGADPATTTDGVGSSALATLTAAPDGRRWVGITSVLTDPDCRRQGLAEQVCADAMRWGADHGATDAYVQVEEPNTAARRLYEKLGFTEHHRYRYASK